MLGRIDRYLLAQLLTLFGFFALILVLVYWVNQAVRLFDRLIADGQSLSVFLLLTALTLPNVIRLVIPTAAFAATLYVINRMSSESELVVAQATGFNAVRLTRPILAFGLVISLAMGALTHAIVPLSLGQLKEQEAEVSENVTARLLREGIFQHPADGMTFYLRELTGEGELLDVFLADTRRPESQLIYTAKRAFLVRSEDGPKLAMINGMVQRLDTETGALTTTRFTEFVSDLAQFSFETTAANQTARETPSLGLLSQDVRSARGVSPAQASAELHERSANALSVLTFVMVGYAVMMTAGFSRFGIWPRALVAIVCLVVLQVLFGVAEDYAVSDPGLWWVWYCPFGGGIALAFVLLWWTTLPFRSRPTRIEAAS